ncbi:MAG TPA: hypothetical protein VFR82_06450 [Nitrospira sp.]|nr:hypothetical protein [Nitrospira sp.]
MRNVPTGIAVWGLRVEDEDWSNDLHAERELFERDQSQFLKEYRVMSIDRIRVLL